MPGMTDIEREVQDIFDDIFSKITREPLDKQESLIRLNEYFGKLKISKSHLFESIKEGLKEMGYEINNDWLVIND
ncbi:MAG: hypothetical protein ACXW01_00675 [Methylobacter sp.]